MRGLKYALRTASKSPAFTITALLTLVLAIGANTDGKRKYSHIQRNGCRSAARQRKLELDFVLDGTAADPDQRNFRLEFA